MTLERLRCFVAVAEQLNFTKAAQDRHIAQTAMSRQISMLEEELGCRLFDRDNRTVSLTPSGKVFYEGVVVLLEQYRETVEKTRAARQGTTGALRVGIGQYERTFVSQLVGEFHQNYPLIEVTVSQYRYKELVDQLKNGLVDVIFALPISADYMAGQKVDIQELFTSEICVLMSREHPLARLDHIGVDDMIGHAGITISENDGPCSLENFWARTKRYGFPITKAIQANSLEVEFLMLEARMGIAFAPYFLKEELPPKLTAVRLTPGLYPLEKFVSMIRQDNRNPAARIFVGGIQTSRTLWERLERSETGAVHP